MNRAWRKVRRLATGDEGFGLVEALIAVTILVIGLLAVSGLSLAAATQARVADWQAEQAEAGQVAIESVQMSGFAAAASRTDTVTIDGHDYVVSITVTALNGRVKDVQAQVSAVGSLPARTFSTRLYLPRSLPAPPAP
jgi:Tfp pilus assembly protein PilV